jgi:hypothetical protein
MATQTKKRSSGWRRVAWFVAIYAGSVIALAAVAYGLKAIFGGLLG